VWLVTGGALFAVFPDAYATVFSGFYTPFMLLLVSLILRAVAIEFRGKVSSPMWRRMWDIAFAKRGYPESITVDNGSESCSRMMVAWAYRHGVKLDFIRPREAGGERIYRELQWPTADECLNVELFWSVEDAPAKLESGGWTTMSIAPIAD
jgi:hypothetical protein